MGVTTERASRIQNAPTSAKTDAPRASMACSEFYERVTGRKLSDAAKAVLDAPKSKPPAPIPAKLRGVTLDFIIVDDVVTP